jgi:hypothetical protein
LANERYHEFYGVERTRTQEDFWRTRRKSEKKEKQDATAGGPPH